MSGYFASIFILFVSSWGDTAERIEIWSFVAVDFILGFVLINVVRFFFFNLSTLTICCSPQQIDWNQLVNLSVEVSGVSGTPHLSGNNARWLRYFSNKDKVMFDCIFFSYKVDWLIDKMTLRMVSNIQFFVDQVP